MIRYPKTVGISGGTAHLHAVVLQEAGWDMRQPGGSAAGQPDRETPGGAEVLLVSSATLVWHRLRARGYRRTEGRAAERLLAAPARRQLADLRRLVADVRLSRSVERLDDAGVVQVVRAALRAGALIAIRRDPAAELASRTRTLRELAKAVEAAGPGFGPRGLRYRLVADVDVGDLLEGREEWRVLPRAEADGVLARMAPPGTGVALARLVARARELLSHDWRRPFEPDGLILLHRQAGRAFAGTGDQPAITPSQMKALVDAAESLAEVRIQLHDHAYRPCPGLACVLSFADGSVVETQSNGTGWVRCEVPVKSIGETGQVRVEYRPYGAQGPVVRLVAILHDPAPDAERFTIQLFNLGFLAYAGVSNEALAAGASLPAADGDSSAAFVGFQHLASLGLTGTRDAQTAACLRRMHGGGDDAVTKELG